MEELYQATPGELKENRRLLQVQGDDSYITTVAFMDRALKKAQVREELRVNLQLNSVLCNIIYVLVVVTENSLIDEFPEHETDCYLEKSSENQVFRT